MKLIFIESPIFEKQQSNYFDDDGYRKFQEALLENPKVGDVIQGSGGIRKVRWAIKGRGKRGGIRIIYYHLERKNKLFLMTIYAKNEMKDLTKEQIKIVKNLMEEWVEDQN